MLTAEDPSSPYEGPSTVNCLSFSQKNKNKKEGNIRNSQKMK